MTAFRIFLLTGIFLFILLIGCNTKSKITYDDIRGGWWYVSFDSTYSEAYIRNDSIWDLTQIGGIWLRRIELKGDSIKVLNLDGVPLATSHISLEHSNQFIITDDDRSWTFNRLSIEIDPKKQFAAKDTTSNLYGFWNRTEDWYKREHAK